MASLHRAEAIDSRAPVQDKLHKEEEEQAPEASGEAAQQSSAQSTHHLPPELLDDVSPISLVRHVRPLLLAVTNSYMRWSVRGFQGGGVGISHKRTHREPVTDGKLANQWRGISCAALPHRFVFGADLMQPCSGTGMWARCLWQAALVLETLRGHCWQYVGSSCLCFRQEEAGPAEGLLEYMRPHAG